MSSLILTTNLGFGKKAFGLLLLVDRFKDVVSKRHLLRYLKFVKHYANVERNCVTERHHVLPKSLYPEFAKDEWNLVDLPLRVHFISHWMLAKALGGKMWYAFYAMCNKNTKNGRLEKYNSVMYETSKRKFSQVHAEWHNQLTDGIQNKKLVGAKTKETKLKTPGYYQKISKKSAKTMTSIIQENGLTIAQNRSLKSAKTTRDTGVLKGSNNANSNVIKVYDSNGELQHTFFGDFTEKTKTLKLPTTALKKSYRTGTKIYQSKTGKTIANKSGFQKFIGWYAVNLGKCKQINR